VSWWRIVLGVLGLGVGVIAAFALRDSRQAKMALLELRKLIADRQRAKESSDRLKAEATTSLIDAEIHRSQADDAGKRAKVIEDEIASQTRDLLRDMPDTERVRRFKRRLGIDS